MVLMEMNEIRGTPQPSEEYHHLELRAVELPKIRNSFGKPQWDSIENDEEWFQFFVWPLTDVVSSSYFQDPRCPWVLSIGGIWTSYSNAAWRYARSNIFVESWKCKGSHCKHMSIGFPTFRKLDDRQLQVVVLIRGLWGAPGFIRFP